jgi:hypothetical protein
MSRARKLRDHGMTIATIVQPDEWRAAVDDRIAALAATGEPFTADDVSSVVGDSPTGSQGAMGARFNAAVRRRVIVCVGYVPSRRTSTHLHRVAQWVGAA